MAKINLTNQQNQENPSVVVTLASLGVLLCMVVTVMGIKLWWFKHRLSFDQTTTQNGAAGGNPPTVVIPRRNKKQKYKDKRWSQQIYENVEVHGVFRQKTEDDMEIQRPQQLPPVRIRQLSASTQSLILPPPRNTRGQVNSTAFEDMEIGTSITLTPTASTSAITNTNMSDTKFSLTFEEFEKQFKLKEIKPELTETAVKTEEVIEIPVPPLRLNRSSSAMQNPEKTPRYLKSSQSMAIPEFHKVKERRQTGFSRPTEDLTRIDDYEELKPFENFGERRPTGYIKYEEVDRDLTEQYEKELNQEANFYDNKFMNNDNWESSKYLRDVEALESLRNESIIYQNDLNESPEVINLKIDNFSKANQVDFMKREYVEDFKDPKFKELLISKKEEEKPKRNENIEISIEYEDYDDILSMEHEEEMAFKSVKDRRPTEFVRDLPAEITNEFTENIDSLSIPDVFDNQFLNWPQFEEQIETPKVNVRNFKKHDFETQTSIEGSEDLKTKSEKPVKTFDDEEHILIKSSSTDFKNISVSEHGESTDLRDNENFEKSSPTQKLLYSQLRSIMTEETREFPDKPEVTFNISETLNSDYEGNENSVIKQIIPTRFDSKNKEEEYNSFENIELPEKRQVKFVSSDFEKSKNEWNENSPIKQRRPTGFVRSNKEREEDMERLVTFNFTNDRDYKKDIENSTLNQRRPTGYSRNDNIELGKYEMPKSKAKFENSNSSKEDSDDYEDIVINELQKSKVKFSDNIIDTQKDTEIWLGKQRRPTGYIKKSEMEEFSNDITEITFNESTIYKESEYDLENSLVNQRRPTGYIKKSKMEDNLKVTFNEINDFKESESNSENSSIKQRRPTGFTKELYREDTQIKDLSNDMLLNNNDSKEILKTSSVRFQDIEPTNKNSKHLNEFHKKQKTSTGFVTTPDIEKLFESSVQVNFELNNFPQHQDENYKENTDLKTRRPTGYVRNYYSESRENSDQDPLSSAWLNIDIKSPEIVDPLWQEMEKDLDHNFTQNIDEEFSKIRHSYELNEGDFLELKNELSTTVNTTKNVLGFGKTIEDDWENFEKLKTPKTLKLKGEEQTEIQITYNEEELNTTSILKETKVVKEELDIIKVEEIKAKPRKSKVTFDFKTEEHLIPARSAHLDSEEDEYYEDNSEYDDDDKADIYDKPQPSMPPQPKQRLSNIKYSSELPSTSSSSSAIFTPVVTIPTSISLFGSQVSQEDSAEEDSWSAIRKHRNLTEEFQHISLDSSTPSSPCPVAHSSPPKPAYRNPLAQLAIQRAKEVKTEMGDFKARSINDARKPPQASKRNQQRVINFHNDDFYDTEA